MIGQRLGHYRILEKIGAGGMGVVYRARDERLERDVALKVLPAGMVADEAARARLRKEALALSRLNHPNIATVHDFNTQEGTDFLVMEYIPGTTLADRVAGGPLPENETIRLGTQLAQALAAAQAEGVVHNDLNPGNLRVTPDGRLKILDFGLANLLRPLSEAAAVTETQTVKEEAAGTLPYMAPEQLRGEKTDERTDIYAAGVVLYEMSTGRRPFPAPKGARMVTAILHEAPLPPHRLDCRVSPALESIILKALDKDPDRRYQTARELTVDLERANLPATATAERRRSRQPAWIVGAALATVLILIVGAIPGARRAFLRGIGRPPVPEQKILAVLPFQSIGGGPENQAYCDGLTETLAARLSQLTTMQGFQLAPASEVRTRRVASPEQARKELGVNLALTGSLHRAGDTVRVNFALVETATMRQLGADTLTAPASNPFAFQDSVVAHAARLLEVELRPRDRASPGTQVAGAHDFYLQGRGYLQNYDKPENVDNSVSVFERALQLDPNYALAHAGLGDAYWKKYESTKEPRWLEAARRACERAVALDGQLAAARICLGTLYTGGGEYKKAAAEFLRAVEREPTSDDAYRGLARAQERLGNVEEAEKTYRQAIRLRPHYWAGYSWLGRFLAEHGRNKEAVEQYEQAVALTPDNFLGYYSLGGIYIHMGRYQDAIQALRKSIDLRPSAAAYSNLGSTYIRLRRFSEAVQALERAQQYPGRDHRIAGNLARAYYWAPGKRALASATYETAIGLARERLQVNPKDANVLIMLAQYDAMLGRRKDAFDALRSAFDLDPQNHEFLAIAAVVHNQFGEQAAAVQYLEKAIAGGYSRGELETNIELDNLRQDPKFQALIRPN